MTEIEFCRKHARLGGEENRTVIYALTVSKTEFGELFGIAVRIAETGEAAFAPELTLLKDEAERLLDMVATGLVTPTTLLDIVTDWIG